MPIFGFTYSGGKGITARGQQTLSTSGKRPNSRMGGISGRGMFFLFLLVSFFLPLKAVRSSIHVLKVCSHGLPSFGSVQSLKDDFELRTKIYASPGSHKEECPAGPSVGIHAARQWGPPPKL